MGHFTGVGFMKRSIWIPEDAFRDIKMSAALSGKSLGKYLIGLHVESRRGVIVPFEVPLPALVDSEELDLHPEKYPVGTIGITDPEKAIKKPFVPSGNSGIIVNIEEPVVEDPRSDSAGTGEFVSYPKSKSVDPGGTGKKSRMK